jgi:serine/threonine-protein kinase
MQADENAELKGDVCGLAPGDVIGGKYRLDAILGRGGMSVVYRATHLELDQPVAIKVLSAEALVLPGYVQRLKREARAVSKIRSEHVVRVHDIGQLEASPGIPAVPYLVMEHLSGMDLADLVRKRGPLPIRMAIECILQACEALAEAHALGIVHRDLKPANLFLTECADGSPCIKVLDFGISRMSQRYGLTSLTDPGTVLGTPSYMPPEQMEGSASLDCRSDIWALGAILYELLTGKTPFGHDALPKLFVRVMRSPTPKASHLRPSVPAAIDAVIARCLSRDPAQRYPSVAHLATALSAHIPNARAAARRVTRVFDRRRSEESGISTPPVSFELAVARQGARRRTQALCASAGVLVIAAIFGGLAARGALTTVNAVTSKGTVEARVPSRELAPAETAVLIPTVVRTEEPPVMAALAPIHLRTAPPAPVEAKNGVRARAAVDAGAAVDDPSVPTIDTEATDPD